MMKYRVCLIPLVVLAVLPALAEGEDEELMGSIEVGHRNVTISGNEDKYREDVNLDTSFFVPEFELSWGPEAKGWLDGLTLSAENLGNQPYSSARFEMRKIGLYDLNARYRSSNYFYQDAGYFFREGGDLHVWDTKRDFYDLDFKYQPTDWLTVRLGGDRNNRNGASTTSRDLQREDFVFDRPVRQSARSWWLGADFRLGWADVSLEQRWAKYENQWLLTASRTDGLQPGGAYLNSYRQFQVQDADAPVSRISGSGRPLDWLRFSAGYAHVDADFDYKVEGMWDGLDYDESPSGPPSEAYATTLSNHGKVKRNSDLYDAAVTFGVSKDIDLTADFSRKTYEEKGTIDLFQEQVGGKDAGVTAIDEETRDKLTLDTYELAADWRTVRTLTLSAGIGHQKRIASYQLADADVETKRAVYRLGARWRPTQVWDVNVRAERGNDDNPYTPASPTFSRRYRADVRIKPIKSLSVTLRCKDELRENDQTYELEIPTDDTPPRTSFFGATFKVRTFGAAVAWSPIDRLNLSAGYDRTKLQSDTDIDYVIGEAFVPAPVGVTTLQKNRYNSTQETLRGEARVRFKEGWSGGLFAAKLDNDGTFPLTWERYGADARYENKAGWHVRVGFEFYRLKEDNPYAGGPALPTPHVNNYKANLWTVAAGYRF